MLLVANPIPLELGPSEATWIKFVEGALKPQLAEREAAWRQVLASSGSPFVDLWPSFFDVVNARVHRPLYSADSHLTEYGREIVGRAVAEELIKLRPWSRR
jgi:hypothetical protein